MNDPAADLARIRFDNALLLFDEFVQQAARHPDAATLRGLEGRFAERLGIQPSYWSQIKAGSRQIGERLARQFESRCRKPYGWMDRAQGSRAGRAAPAPAGAADDDRLPHSEDERFIVGLVLSYYRRHPDRARARLLELLGEVLAPPPPSPSSQSAAPASVGGKGDDADLWRRTASAIAPLKRKR